MKRSVELDTAVTEIIEAANTRDTIKGGYVHDFMNEPLIFTMMEAADAFLAILKYSPIAFLNVLELNRDLQRFWNSFRRIWVILLDNLIDMLGGSYNAAIYPLLLVAYHNHQEEMRPLCSLSKDDTVYPSVFRRKEIGSVRLLDALRLDTFGIQCEILSRHTQPECFSLSRDAQYWLIYYDPITELFVSLTQKLLLLFPLAPLFAFPSLNEYFSLPEYKRFVFFASFMLTDSEENARSVSYKLASLREQVNSIADDLGSFSLNEQGQLSNPGRALRNDYPQAVIDAVIQVRDMARRLQLLLVQNPFSRTVLVIPPPEVIKLTPELAQPYKERLFDEERGIYSTPTQQKQLFLDTLAHASESYCKARIDEFRAPLQCASCSTETMQVDPLLSSPFCTSFCRSVYLAHHQ